MLPPKNWPNDKLTDMCGNFLKITEVYINDFYRMVQITDVPTLRNISRLLLHTIHSILPPPDISGYYGGDPMSNKNVLEVECIWDVQKEIIGWVFDGT